MSLSGPSRVSRPDTREARLRGATTETELWLVGLWLVGLWLVAMWLKHTLCRAVASCTGLDKHLSSADLVGL